MKNILKDFGEAAADGFNDVAELYAKREKAQYDKTLAYSFARGMINGLMGMIVINGIQVLVVSAAEKLHK